MEVMVFLITHLLMIFCIMVIYEYSGTDDKEPVYKVIRKGAGYNGLTSHLKF